MTGGILLVYEVVEEPEIVLWNGVNKMTQTGFHDEPGTWC